MKGSKFNENQIISILREADGGIGIEGVCQKYGIGRAIYEKWFLRYGGLAVYEMERISNVEGELRELKRKYAELVVENDTLKSLIERNLI